MRRIPPTLLVAAGVQVAEATLVAVASVLSGIDAAAGRSYQTASGIALTVIGLVCALALAWIAVGLARARPWSRTPALMTHLFVGIIGIYLLQGHRLAWGVPAVVLAVTGFVVLLVPVSLRALAAEPPAGAGGGPRAR